MTISKPFVAAILSLLLSALGAAAKSYVDVEKLKTQIDLQTKNNESISHDIKTELTEIKKDIKSILKDLPKGG
jgi:cell division protein FtsB